MMSSSYLAAQVRSVGELAAEVRSVGELAAEARSVGELAAEVRSTYLCKVTITSLLKSILSVVFNSFTCGMRLFKKVHPGLFLLMQRCHLLFVLF